MQKPVSNADLQDCVNAARLAPSAANLQPLEYIIVTKKLKRVFACLGWAGYLKRGAPKHGNRPVAYIVVISNKNINENSKYDVGLAVGSILLTALERRIAGCIIGSLQRGKLKEICSIPDTYNIELVIALGYPKEKSVIVEYKNDVKYWLEKDILYVPKKKLTDIVHKEQFNRMVCA